MGIKPHDKWTVPLCHSCHSEQHMRGEISFHGDGLEKAKKLASDLYSAKNRQEKLRILIRYRLCT